MEKYILIYEEIKNKINDGTYKSYQKLKSKRQLSQDYGVSINTIMNSLNLLLDEGYIYSIEKKGYFVSNQLTLDIKPKNQIIEHPIKIKYKYDFTTSNINDFNDNNYKKIIRNLINENEYIEKSDFLGNIKLRGAISSHLKINRGIDVDPNLIIIGYGLESLRNILRIIDIDNITLENPGYHKLKNMALNLNLNVNYIDIDEFGTKIPSNKTIIYTTPFNQFPLGIKMTMPRKKEFSEFLNKTQSYLIEDDFDAEFRIKEANKTPIFSLSDRVIFFSTFSMTMYPGLRISYFILPKELRDKYILHYSGYSSSISNLDQLALAEYIRMGYYASHINKLKKKYLNKRLLIMEILDKYNISYDDKKNYLSILIKTNVKNIDLLIDNLKKRDLIISSIKDYDEKNLENDTLILGYTSINDNDIKDGLDILISEINNIK